MTLVLQLLLTALSFAAVAWAIGGHFQDVGRQVQEISPFAGANWRRPWLAYGMLLVSAGLFLMMSEMSFSGFADEPQSLTFGISMLTILAGGALSFCGLVDKYVVRRGAPELPAARMRKLMSVFVAGAVLLPTLAILVVLLGRPSGPVQPPQSPAPRQSYLPMPSPVGQGPRNDVVPRSSVGVAGNRHPHRSSCVPTYTVHLFPVVRIQVPGIEAADHREAVEQAVAQTAPGLYGRFERASAEYAEEISHYLVDVAGDEEFRQSQWFYSADEPLLAILRRLVAWDKNGRADPGALTQIIAESRSSLDNSA